MAPPKEQVSRWVFLGRWAFSQRKQLPTLRAGVALVLFLTLDAKPKKRLPTPGVALNLFLMLSSKKGAATYPVGTLCEPCGKTVGTLWEPCGNPVGTPWEPCGTRKPGAAKW